MCVKVDLQGEVVEGFPLVVGQNQVEYGGFSGSKFFNEISEKSKLGGGMVVVKEVKDVEEDMEGVVCGNSFAVLSDGENDLGLDS
ncbi:hypothetical protein LWI28_009966 [Acer negundo]|uniref:Uncharacterized protein n=1 Tax=Acer negundo TaxID=4023 RepID=A0AAD5J4F3_ACENE|nr:hypothetical protein LWI28_009966 [Acer negundo]